MNYSLRFYWEFLRVCLRKSKGLLEVLFKYSIFLFYLGFYQFPLPFLPQSYKCPRFQSLSEGSSSASFWGSGAEHEANNYLEEVTHHIQQRQQLSPEHQLLLSHAHPGNSNPGNATMRTQMRKPSVDNWIETRLPDGDSQIFKIVCVWPSGLLDYGSATLRCKI